MNALRIITAKASSVLSRMPNDLALSILKSLSGFLIFLELFGLSLMEPSILRWALIVSALFGEQPSPCRSSVEYDLHLL